jgi:hypothetical protein
MTTLAIGKIFSSEGALIIVARAATQRTLFREMHHCRGFGNLVPAACPAVNSMAAFAIQILFRVFRVTEIGLERLRASCRLHSACSRLMAKTARSHRVARI